MKRKLALPWGLAALAMGQGGEHLGRWTVRWRFLAPALDQGLDEFEAFKNEIRSGFREEMQATFKGAKASQGGTLRLPRVRWSRRYTKDDGLLYVDLDADCADSDITPLKLARKGRSFRLPRVGRLGPHTAKGTKLPDDVTIVTVFDVQAHHLDQFAKHVEATVSEQLSVEEGRPGHSGYSFATDLVDIWNVKRVTRSSSGVEEFDTNQVALEVKIRERVLTNNDTSDAGIPSHMYAAGSAFRAAHYWPSQLKVDGLPEAFRIEYPGRSCSKASCEQEQEEAAGQARWAQRLAQERERREFSEALSRALRQAQSQAYRPRSPTSGSISASEASSCA